jgi:hypothetical protein
MKKLMSLMLGLTLLVGTTALFADDTKAPKKPASTKTTKGKKSGKKAVKKTDTTSTEKKGQ